MNKINELVKVAKLDNEILGLILFGSITRRAKVHYSKEVLKFLK